MIIYTARYDALYWHHMSVMKPLFTSNSTVCSTALVSVKTNNTSKVSLLHWFVTGSLTKVPDCHVVESTGLQLPRWHNQMETFSALLALCAGNSPFAGEFPAQRPVTRSFDAFFDLRLNKRFSKQPWGWWFETPSCSLLRHCNDRCHHYSILHWSIFHRRHNANFDATVDNGHCHNDNFMYHQVGMTTILAFHGHEFDDAIIWIQYVINVILIQITDMSGCIVING